MRKLVRFPTDSRGRRDTPRVVVVGRVRAAQVKHRDLLLHVDQPSIAGRLVLGRTFPMITRPRPPLGFHSKRATRSSFL